jgi:hypothetical protein
MSIGKLMGIEEEVNRLVINDKVVDGYAST